MIKDDSYWEALDRVKVGEFVKRGYSAPIRGIVHVGANDGYEVEWYKKITDGPIVCFEPASIPYLKLSEHYPGIIAIRCGLGNIECVTQLYIADGDAKGSSVSGVSGAVGVEEIRISRWPTIVGQWELNPKNYNCCVIDVQGMELDVLRGMDELIKLFDYFVVECSAKPQFPGEAWGDEVVAYMSRNGFDAITPISIHDDVLFVKRDFQIGTDVFNVVRDLPDGTKLNCGSGQRPFDRAQGWINIDCNPRWNPDVLTDWNNLSMFEDNSMELVVAHHTIEHVGCGEADGFIREANRVLRPGGSLLVFVPDMKALAQRWLVGGLDEYQYMVNIYGAYMGDDADRHKWGYSRAGLVEYLRRAAPWRDIHAFHWRTIAGADIAHDWWIIGIEAIK